MTATSLPLILMLLAAISPVARAEPGRLHPVEVTASTSLQSSWAKFQENYHPNYVADDNPATAWVEGAAGDGVGERLTLRVGPARGATAVTVRLRPGYQKSEGLLKANGAPKRVRVDARSASGVIASGELALERAMGWRELRLELPADSSLSAVEITVLEVHPGSKYADTCISDVAVVLESAEPYRGAIENARQQAILRWIESRRAMAAAYAAAPAAYPFASGASVQEPLARLPADAEAQLRDAAAALDAVMARSPLYRPARKKPAAPLPDGWYALDEAAEALVAGETSYFETRDPWVKVKREGGDDEGWSSEDRIGAAHVEWLDAGAGQPRAVAWTRKSWGDERMRWSHVRDVMVRYDDKGRAELYVERSEEDGELHLKRLRVIRIGRDADGKINAMEELVRTEDLDAKPAPPGRIDARTVRIVPAAPSSP